MSTNLHVMGNRIRTARQFRKLTAEQLSEQLGIATESLRHIENGTRRPSYALLDNISDILDVSLDYLVGMRLGPTHSLLCLPRFLLWLSCGAEGY